MKLTTLWIVRDAEPHSTLADICFEHTFTGLANYIAGSPAGAWEGEHHVGYTSSREAEVDANARLDRVQSRGREAGLRRSTGRSTTPSGLSERYKRIRRLGRGL